MQVEVTGVKCDAETLQEAAAFFASCLMDPRMVRNIVLNIDVKYGSKNDPEWLGDCEDDDGGRNPRWFTINLRKQKTEEMVKTLAHEMVHLKQHAKNEFRGSRSLHRSTSGSGGIWKGQVWKPSSREHPYFDAPWEVEAFGKEVGLYHRWKAR